MIDVIFCDLKTLMFYEHAGQFFCRLVVSFVVTGGRSWSFQTPNLEVFKTIVFSI